MVSWRRDGERIFIWTLRNKFQWISNRNSYIFIQQNVFENVVSKMETILYRPQCVKAFILLLPMHQIKAMHVAVQTCINSYDESPTSGNTASQTQNQTRLIYLTIPWRHDDVIKWKHFPRYWSFARGIHRLPVNSPHKGQWCGALVFSLICAWINGWVNNHEAGDLRRHRAHYDILVI